MPELCIADRTCSRCGQCRMVCPLRVIEQLPGGLPRYVPAGAARCIVCGHCEAVCPTGALTLTDPQLDPATYPPGEPLRSDQVAGYLRQRRSIRFFRPEPVPRATVAQLLDLVRYAPSGSNRQPVHWLVIHDTAELRRLTGLVVDWLRTMADGDTPLARAFNITGMIRAWEKGNDPICRNAPHLAIAHVHGGTMTARDDGIIALSWFDAAAPAFGIGTCWAGFFQFAATSWEPLRQALALPAGHETCSALLFGFPAVAYQRPPKRDRLRLEWR